MITEILVEHESTHELVWCNLWKVLAFHQLS